MENTMGIEEGKVVKGGWNKKPTSKRPPPPKGQGFKHNDEVQRALSIFPKGQVPYPYKIEELAKEVYQVYKAAGMTDEAIIQKVERELIEFLHGYERHNK